MAGPRNGGHSKARRSYRWQPWTRSTGPRSEAGKAASATNALRHGLRSRILREELRRLRDYLTLCDEAR